MTITACVRCNIAIGHYCPYFKSLSAEYCPSCHMIEKPSQYVQPSFPVWLSMIMNWRLSACSECPSYTKCLTQETA
jgi:hypothetical protein